MRWWVVVVAAAACTGAETSLPDRSDLALSVRGASVALSDPYVCTDPSARSAGHFGHTAPLPQPDDGTYGLTRSGIIVGDFDGDTRLEVLLPHESQTELWSGEPGSFADLAPLRLAGLDLRAAVGGSAVDVEGDGDLDLYLTRWQRPNLLLRNDGTGHFDDVTALAGLDSPGWRSQSSSWADFDLDGDLDLFSASYGPDLRDLPGDFGYTSTDLPPSEDRSQLWTNNGDGTFTDASDLLPHEAHDGWSFMSSWVDTTGDGYPELFVWNDFGSSHPSLVLGNDGGEGFVLALGETSIDRAFEDMGVAIADLDGDQLPDFALTSYKKISLLVSQPADTYAGARWIESATARSLAVDWTTWDQYYGWGAAFGDLDHDRDEDLVAVFGRWSTYDNVDAARTQRDGLWLQGPGGSFENVAATPEWQLDAHGVKRGLAVVDLNDDGFLDLVKRQLNGPALRYESRCDDTAWLRVVLQQPDQNPNAVGARVTATSPDGTTQTRWVTLGSTSMYSSVPPEAHFGLGDDETVDLEIRWPDQGVSVARDVPTRRVATVTRR